MARRIRAYIFVAGYILRAAANLVVHGLARPGRPAAMARDGRLAPR